MREIKFRGLRIGSSEWVYGSLVNNLWVYSENGLYPHEKVHEIITDQFSCDDYDDMQANQQNVTVIPQSVGQYTGLKDLNGKEIFQGDILQTTTDKAMAVSWSNKYASFVLNREGWAFSHWFGESCDPDQCVVIGNIHQNPELLKGKS